MQTRIIDLPDNLKVIRDWFIFYANLILEQSIYNENKVFRIDAFGLDYVCKAPRDVLHCSNKDTIKVEGLECNPEIFQFIKNILETYFAGEERIATVHLFKAKENGHSFPVHTDPVDLLIYCVEGIKTMEVNGLEYTIPKDSGLFMPANTPHRATNKHDSVMLSIGFEKP